MYNRARDNYKRNGWYYILCAGPPAVSNMENRSSEKFTFVGKREASVKMRTHNSNEPISSSTEVNILSNPTDITKHCYTEGIK